MRAIHLPTPGRRFARAFTLTELLVVIGIIAVLGVLTAVSYRGIAKDAKLASGKNTLMAVLDTARGLAMKRNKIVMVVFRPRLDGKNQYMEAVFTEWSGQTGLANVPFRTAIDRFVPIQDAPTRRLPIGLKIAGPDYSGRDATGGAAITDNNWLVPSHLPAINQQTGNGEIPGEVVAVMYGPDGVTLSSNSNSDSTRIWIDYANTSPNVPIQRIGAAPGIDYFTSIPTISAVNYGGGYFEQRLENEEPFIRIAPFLAIFDDDKAREAYDPSTWNPAVNAGAGATRANDYRAFINANADRIHFNRYTGVAMK